MITVGHVYPLPLPTPRRKLPGEQCDLGLGKLSPERRQIASGGPRGLRGDSPLSLRAEAAKAGVAMLAVTHQLRRSAHA